ncbi:MAG: DUF4959 domain-containing protein [Butyricimonas faecihominis]
MMKNIFLLLLLICGLFACKDDEAFFDASIPRESIRFKAVPGGAVMYYTLPENSDIFAVRAIYRDEKGDEMMKVASYAYDSLVLDGFNVARNDVSVKISLLDQSNKESRAMELTFNTENSIPVAFFDKIKVAPYWEGFSVAYEVPTGAKGLCNVFIIGINPMTQKLDTLLLETFPIESGKNIKYFEVAQKGESNTVVVKTEDFRGNVAMQKVYEGITSYHTEKFDSKDFEWLDPFSLSVEDDNDGTRFGWKYLFDGDVKGTQKMALVEKACRYPLSYNMYTFLAGPFAVNTPDDPKYFILDIKKAKQVGQIKMYAMLYGYHIMGYWGRPNVFGIYSSALLPNWVTIYASNDKDDPVSWKEIGNFYESVTTAVPWMQRAWNTNSEFQVESMEEMEAADPCFLSISFPIDTPAYRYFKIEFNGVFKTVNGVKGNDEEYVTLHEVEVYGKQ